MKKTFTLFLLFSLMYILLIALFYFDNNAQKEGFDNKKSCCLYAYYEKNDKYKNNFEYFLQNGILEDVDYYIIINGTSTVTVPEGPNVTVFHRENIGFDFGAYSHAIDRMNQKYDYYFFLNTSVCGPYLHDNSKKWTEYFIELFNKDDIKIVGTSINICNYPTYKPAYADKNFGSHVQSMFFCLNREYFEYLQSIDYFNEEKLNTLTMPELIMQYEIGMSQIALNKGWNINCILSKYKDLDYRTLDENSNEASVGYYGDPYYEGSYFGNTIDKYEVIFFKNARF